jgi:hypothetical protein
MIGRVLVPLLLAVAATGCDDFATPAELTKPTVLAVIADPPLVAPGKSAQVTIVMAGPDGPIAAPAVTWTLAETYPGIAPFGTLATNPDGSATYLAPDPLPALPDKVPPVVSVQAVVAGEPPAAPIDAIKVIGVIDVPATNPVISDITFAGASGGAAITVDHGATLDLAATLATPLDDKASYAWYSTAGTIARYQSNPTSLVAAAVASSGWVYVVVRDGKGGTAVRSIAVTVR